MDTTPKYIKMCEKAEEIQELYQEILQQPREAGRKSLKCWVVARTKGVEPPYAFSIQLHVFALINYPANLIECIWLPRQDQLQKMVEWNFTEQGFSNGWGFAYTHIDDMFRAFWEWREKEIKAQHRGRLGDESITAEQLWLAFVMCKKYDKHWDNEKEEWVK